MNLEEKEDCGCSEPEKMGRGGMFKGPSHDGGGIPVVVKDTGQEVEVEGKEPLIPREVIEDDVVRTRKGTNKEIVNEVLKKEGTSIKNTPKEVLGGDNVICKRAIHDDNTVRKITGTDAQIISAVNESGGCKQIEPGAKVVEMREGGSIFKFYWRYKPKSDLDKMLKTKMFAAKDALKWLDENRADVDFAIMYDAATKKIAGTYFKGKTNLVSEELKRENYEINKRTNPGMAEHTQGYRGGREGIGRDVERPEIANSVRLASTKIFHELQHATQRREGVTSPLTGDEVSKEGGSTKKTEPIVAKDWIDAHTRRFNKGKYHR